MPRPRLPSPPSAFLYRQQATLYTSAAALRPVAAAVRESARQDEQPIIGLPSIRQRAQARISNVEHELGTVSPLLTDSFGRRHDYLRISLTEKCNLRCTYCMPEAGVPLLPRDDLLTTDEVERVARMFVQHGVTKIRLTGGEPTIRKDIVDVVARLGRLPLTSLGMTSNGIALKRKLPALVAAGLTHLNLSLDTLDPLKYDLMTRRRGFSAVMEALEVARSLPGLKTKINMVVIRGLNDMEVPDFVELTRDMDITVRCIEFMPFEDNRWNTKKLVPSAELVSHLQELHPMLMKLKDPHSDTTRSWQVPGYKGRVGFISSMSDHFCGECSRLRVGADGGVKVCLFGPPVLALRPLLRSSTTSDANMMQEIGQAVWGKKWAHNGLGAAPAPSMLRTTARRPLRGSGALVGQRRSTGIPLHLLPFSSNPTAASLRYSSTTHGSLPATGASAPTPDLQDGDEPRLTHIDPTTGRASMVSVSAKPNTLRSATAVGRILLNEAAWSLIDFGEEGQGERGVTTMRTKKGDVLTTAHLAAIMAPKHTAFLIPLCHPLLLSSIKVDLVPLAEERAIEVRATVECKGKTGVEMEALSAVMVGCLTVWDMTKSVSGKESRVGEVMVVAKSGGRSGEWTRGEGEGR